MFRPSGSTDVCPGRSCVCPSRSSLPSRRDTLAAGAAAAAAAATLAIVPRHVLGAADVLPPSERPALLGIGVGGVGFGQVQAAEKAGFQVVALCDVDDVYAKKAFDRWPQARRYRDFREAIAAEGDKVDAVYCGTPDHTHALIAVAALTAKKHVCCVKPLTRTIHESRVVLEAARKAGTATQVTASPHTDESGCRIAEWIAAGVIGDVREVHIWSNRPLWPQGMLPPEDQDAVPPTLDWNLWIGPAPMRPYKAQWPAGHYAIAQMLAGGAKGSALRAVYHPWNFRGWWDFGTGALGDMGCHHFNRPFRALRLTHPSSVQATSTKVLAQSAPLASMVTYDFPEREGMPSVRVVWYDGGLKPPCPKEVPGGLSSEGALYLGDKGKLLGAKVLTEWCQAAADAVPKTLERRGGTWVEWFEACRGGQQAGCHFEWGAVLAEAVLLGNIALRTGRRLEWDGPNMRFTNHEPANKYLKEDYQNGWTLEG